MIRTAAAAAAVRLLPAERATRPLALGQLITTTGNGVWYTTWAIFLTSSVGLSVPEVGAGITIAGVLGMVASAPLGRMADHVGPRKLLMALAALQGVSMAGYTQVHNYWTFLAVACVSTVAQRATSGVLTALVTGLSRPEQRLNQLAYLRSVTHVGFTLGATLGAVVLAAGTRSAFVAMVLFNTATYFGLVAGVWLVPEVPPSPRRDGASRTRVLTDAPYLTLALLAGVMALNWGILSTGVPLWIVHHTRAPIWMGAVITFINSIAIAAFQVPVSRSSERPRPAARVLALSGGALAACCGLFALTLDRGGPAAIALLLLGGVALVAGEMLWTAGSYGLSVAFMPEDAQGEYQGVFATGMAGAQMAAPVIMTFLLVQWGLPGWLALAGLFLLAGGASLPAAEWALSTRPAPDRKDLVS